MVSRTSTRTHFRHLTHAGNLQVLITVCSTKCSSQNASCRPQPTAITFPGSAQTFSDRAATDYGSEGWGFESLRARLRARQVRSILDVHTYHTTMQRTLEHEHSRAHGPTADVRVRRTWLAPKSPPKL
jgi:hypothetical protein